MSYNKRSATISYLLSFFRALGFPSTPNVGTPGENFPLHKMNSITDMFPKNISNLSKRDNHDVATTPSLASYQKENVWMKRRTSPVSVLELGRKPANYDREDDCNPMTVGYKKYRVSQRRWISICLIIVSLMYS